MSDVTRPAPADQADGDDRFVETALSTRLIHDEGFLRLRKDQVRLPDGSTGTREVVEHPGAAAVVALAEDGRLLVTRQYRYALARVFVEIPAGKLERGEPPLDCARRELIEETGWRAREWAWLSAIHPAIGFSTERIDIFLARGLEHVGASPDAEEFIEAEAVTVESMVDAIRSGTITDPKTIVGVLAVDRMLCGDWPWPAFEDLSARGD